MMFIILYLSLFCLFAGLSLIARRFYLKRKFNKALKKYQDTYTAAIEEHNQNFMEHHAAKIKDITKQGNTPPIFQNEDGQYYWLTRGARKKLEELKRKGKV